MAYKFVDKRSTSSEINNLQMNVINQLSQHFKKDNIWGVGLADMQLISKCNNGLDFYYV